MPVLQRDFEAGDFHVANDAPFQDDSLSWEAKGVLGYLFSKPEDWTPRIYDLVQSGPCEKHKIKSVFSELEDAGYMHREKYRKDDGTFDWKVTVYDHPRRNPGWTGSTPDGDQPGRDGGANNTDSQSKMNNNNTDTQARVREDDPPGVKVWTDVTGERPSVGTREQLKNAFSRDGGPRWDKVAFQETLREAQQNVEGDADRIRVGYLMSSYKKRLARSGDGAPVHDSSKDGKELARSCR